jgi:hypothetical protein
METVESLILAPTTSPAFRERLIDVLAAAAFTFHIPGTEGFQSTWKRVRPPNKPEDGIPFDLQDSMSDPTRGHRSRATTTPSPRVIHVNPPHSPRVHRSDSRRQDLDQGHRGRQRGRTDHELPLVPYEENSYGEWGVTDYNGVIVIGAPEYETPYSFYSNPVTQV